MVYCSIVAFLFLWPSGYDERSSKMSRLSNSRQQKMRAPVKSVSYNMSKALSLLTKRPGGALTFGYLRLCLLLDHTCIGVSWHRTRDSGSSHPGCTVNATNMNTKGVGRPCWGLISPYFAFFTKTFSNGVLHDLTPFALWYPAPFMKTGIACQHCPYWYYLLSTRQLFSPITLRHISTQISRPNRFNDTDPLKEIILCAQRQLRSQKIALHPRQNMPYPSCPSVYQDNSGYPYYPSSVGMTTSQSQSSDSDYSSEMASPLSTHGPYSTPTSNDTYYNRQITSYQQHSHSSSQSSRARNSQTMSPQNSSSSKKPNRSTKPKPYICLEPGCETSFTRPFDLSRHQKTTHRTAILIDCPEGWCGRSGVPENRGEKGGFSRLDHFYEHVKKVHRKEVIKDARGTMWVKSPDGRLCEVQCTHSPN